MNIKSRSRKEFTVRVRKTYRAILDEEDAA
jgi:hypothetical protein